LFLTALAVAFTLFLTALAVAFTLFLTALAIDLSCVISKYIGETEKNLQRIFKAASHGGAILLFDEADALFGKRTEVKDSHDRNANIEVGYLLQEMEAYQGLAILTTNFPQSIDNAFLRCLRYIVKFPFPDPSARVRIWRGVFPDQTPTEGLNFQKLARLNVAGGTIRNIAKVMESKRGMVAEFLTRANYDLAIGNFELDFTDSDDSSFELY
ncbi:AAA family ATPase, partial [Limnofasciculus baicalensis]